MRIINKILAVAAVAASAFILGSCAKDQFKEVSDVSLRRCLTPTKLGASVNSVTQKDITFKWDVGTDAESYTLEIYQTPELAAPAFRTEEVAPGMVPVTLSFDADQTFYFRVMAHSSQKDDSKWAVYTDESGKPKAIKTKAVGSDLFPKSVARTETSVTLKWTNAAEDYKDVTHIAYTRTDGTGEEGKYELTQDDINAAQATVNGLAASVEYEFILCFKTAERGKICVWTQPDMSSFVLVNTDDGLKSAIAGGQNIKLSMEGSPYTICNDGKGFDLNTGFKLCGEGAADGTMPVVIGSFNITDTFGQADGASVDIWFEGVELNGNGTEGFAIQHKEGSAADGVKVGSITYKNCKITGYSKGLLYEWGKTLDINSFTYDHTQIYAVNEQGLGGGDGFDLRQATKIGTLTFSHCTIYNGFRTFIRIDANPIIGNYVFENNLLMNLCFVDNTNNGGCFAIQKNEGAPVPTLSFKNNLFINMQGKAALAGENAKYMSLSDLTLTAAKNYFYNVTETFFTTHATLAMVSGTELASDPCYNAAGGVFNIVSGSEIAGLEVGPSTWWTPFSKEPEDLTLTALEGAHTWDLTNAKYFVGTSKEPMVRDQLMIVAGENYPVSFEGGKAVFSTATECTSKGLPTNGYLCFKVTEPGSVVVRPVEGETSHVIVATAPAAGSSVVSVKGGASAMAASDKAQKIVINDVAEETMVYVYVSGPIAVNALAWSKDVSDVNTALPAPANVKASPASQKAGEAKDVVVTWDPVDNAGSYSVTFNKKSYPVAEGETTYTIEGKTTGMLDAGAYEVFVYANPAATDIYNTMSAAASASFAILPKGGDEPTGGTVVHSVDELQAALDATKDDITIAADGAPYVLTDALTVTYPVKISGEGNTKPVVEGCVAVSGEIAGDVTISGLTFDDTTTGNGCFITLPETGVTMNTLTIKDCVIKGFSKSVIYGNFDTANIGKILVSGIDLMNHGTGQGVFDFRKGTYGSIVLVGNTFVGGRDFIRADAACQIGEVLINNNTFDGANLGVNGNAILYVRASVPSYKVMNNLWLNEVAEGKSVLLSKASGVAVPDMANNFYYNIDETNFFSGLITKEIGTNKNGVVLTECPVKDAANYDYTLVSGLAISNRVGAPKWNPNSPVKPGEAYTVKSADEFKAALDAGKTEITLAAEGSPYIFTDADVETDASFEVVNGLKIYGEVKDGVYPEFHGMFAISGTEGDLGDIVFKNVKFSGVKADAPQSRGCLLTISGTSSFRSITIKDCIVDNFSKSVVYGSGAAQGTSLVCNGVTVQNHGTGQGVFDMRKTVVGSMAIKNCTIIGGRDLIRADAGTVTAAFDFVNNTVDASNVIGNGNAIMYVRATPAVYTFKNNLFLNEVDETNKVLLSKSSGVSIPTDASGNFFYNYDEANFFSGLFTKEVVKAVCLTSDPVKNAAEHDYTLVDALCLGSNVGASRWNPNHGRVTTEITVASLEELINALNAGKTAITLKYGTYDFTQAPAEEAAFSGGIFTATTPLVLKGEKYAGAYPEIIGGIKFGEGVTDVTVENLVFNGNSRALSIAFEVPAALTVGKILIRNCEVKDYSKSLFYGNAEGAIGAVTLDRLTVHGFGTGQGIIDIRKKLYDAVVVSNSTFYNGGRDFIRVDADMASSVVIRNNTISGVSIDAANSILYVRAAVGDKYVVENNLFLNETGTTTILAKSNAALPVLKNNYFFNCSSGAFWTGKITKENGLGEGIGTVLEADPCVNSAEFNFKVTDAAVKAAKAGDPRWL